MPVAQTSAIVTGSFSDFVYGYLNALFQHVADAAGSLQDWVELDQSRIATKNATRLNERADLFEQFQWNPGLTA